MYLGYLAAGGNSVAQADMSRGLDKVMKEIRDGASLDDVVQKYTHKSLKQFQKDFGTIGASFVKQLVTEVKDGTGGVATGSYNKASNGGSDILSNADITGSDLLLFQVSDSDQWIYNQYPADQMPIYEGGTATNGDRKSTRLNSSH